MPALAFAAALEKKDRTDWPAVVREFRESRVRQLPGRGSHVPGFNLLLDFLQRSSPYLLARQG